MWPPSLRLCQHLERCLACAAKQDTLAHPVSAGPWAPAWASTTLRIWGCGTSGPGPECLTALSCPSQWVLAERHVLRQDLIPLQGNDRVLKIILLPLLCYGSIPH